MSNLNSRLVDEKLVPLEDEFSMIKSEVMSALNHNKYEFDVSAESMKTELSTLAETQLRTRALLDHELIEMKKEIELGLNRQVSLYDSIASKLIYGFPNKYDLHYFIIL